MVPEDVAKLDALAHANKVCAWFLAAMGGQDGLSTEEVGDELAEGGGAGEDDAEFLLDQAESVGWHYTP